MTRQGVVERVNGDFAYVVFDKIAECDKCGYCQSCRGGTSVALRLKNTVGAQTGDKVQVDIGQKRSTLCALIYLLPLSLVAIGIGVGLMMSAAAAAILSSAGLVVGLAVAIPIDLTVFKKRSASRIIDVAAPNVEK